MRSEEDRASCEAFEELVLLHDSGELEGERLERLRTHLDGCRRCASALADLKELQAEARRTAPEPPAQHLERIVAALPDRSTPRAAHAYGLRLVAAVALLAFVSGFGTAHLRPSRSSAPDPVALDDLLAVVGADLTSVDRRLDAITQLTRSSTPAEDIAAALVVAVRRDPSANVRLAAVDALYRVDVGQVPTGTLARSLFYESSTVVRHAIIDYLVARGATDAGDALAAVAVSDAEETVRDHAEWARQRLAGGGRS